MYGKPGPMNINKQFAILFKMGTLEETKDRAWTWVLSAPIDVVQAAGVNFDPNVRSIKSVQGDAGGASSAFEVIVIMIIIIILSIITTLSSS